MERRKIASNDENAVSFKSQGDFCVETGHMEPACHKEYQDQMKPEARGNSYNKR